MALRFGQTRGDDVAALIARKQYARAIEVIKEQLQTQRNDPRIRIQLADVLILAGRPREAMAILSALADEFARDGFATKAIALLKKVQKLDPTQRGVEARLAALIQEKQATVTSSGRWARPPELGMEAADEAAAPAAAAAGDEGLELEIGFGAAPLSTPAAAPAPAPEPVTPAAEPPPIVVVPPPEPEAESAPAPAPMPAPVEDRDLILVEPDAVDLPDMEPLSAELEAEPDPIELDLGAVALAVEPVEDDPVADADFAQELLAAIDEVFPAAPGPAAAAAPPAAAAAGGPSRMVVSPLFRDFAVDEMVAVIQGLKLLAFEAGDLVLSQGDRGESLYMLTAGRVKVFVRGADGRQSAVGELAEGAFFGEIAILTGQPRSATIVAATHCEMLELDRATLDAITRDHPRVWDVLREFAARRARRA